MCDTSIEQGRRKQVLVGNRVSGKLPPMKTLTLELDEPTYEAVVAQATRTGRTEAEVVSAALAPLRQTEQRRSGHSLRDFKPLGLKPIRREALHTDDILDEMINGDRD